MGKMIKYSNRFGFILALCLMILSGCSCSTSKPAPYPLAGWRPYFKALDQSIVTDYQNYIQNLSPEEKKYMGPTEPFEDGTGQHAVQIETDIGGKDAWYHILFYDKDNKRTKVIKYLGLILKTSIHRAHCCWVSPPLDERCIFKYRLRSPIWRKLSRFMNLTQKNGLTIENGGNHV